MPNIADIFSSIPGLKADYKTDWVEDAKADWKYDWDALAGATPVAFALGDGLVTAAGTLVVGDTLTATIPSDAFVGFPSAETYEYLWEDSADGNAPWTTIVGATASTYVLVVGDVGNFIRVTVTADNGVDTPIAALASVAVGPVLAA